MIQRYPFEDDDGVEVAYVKFSAYNDKVMTLRDTIKAIEVNYKRMYGQYEALAKENAKLKEALEALFANTLCLFP